ncbi:MAG: hypothetical protein IJR28_04420, partial [Ottowia sp.]|nr:hypothetical protein [Ottowia sp.]
RHAAHGGGFGLNRHCFAKQRKRPLRGRSPSPSPLPLSALTRGGGEGNLFVLPQVPIANADSA